MLRDFHPVAENYIARETPRGRMLFVEKRDSYDVRRIGKC